MTIGRKVAVDNSLVAIFHFSCYNLEQVGKEAKIGEIRR